MRRALMGMLLSLTPVPVAAQAAPEYETTRIADGVYQFRWRTHNGLFVVTARGVVAFDPISTEAAAQFGTEIRMAVPDARLRAIVYSHHHADHATGADVLRQALQASRAPVIAHRKAYHHIVETPSEAQPEPDVHFTDTLTLQDPARPIELHYLGPSHSDDIVVAYLPVERIVFAVDFVSHDRVGYRDLASFHFPAQFQAIERLLELPFARIVFGHGPPGDRAAVERQLRYYRDLRDAVERAVAEGLSEDEAAARVRLPEYAGWGGYENWFALNVRGMYRWVANRGS